MAVKQDKMVFKKDAFSRKMLANCLNLRIMRSKHKKTQHVICVHVGVALR